MKKVIFGAALALGLAVISSHTAMAADAVSINDLTLVQEEISSTTSTVADNHHGGHGGGHGGHGGGHDGHHGGHGGHGGHHHHHGGHHHHWFGATASLGVNAASIPSPVIALN